MKFSLSDLILRDMTPDEMKRVYETDMRHVFPADELRPCGSICRDMLENRFLACGLYAGDELTGYVLTACVPGRDWLFGQYVAVKREYRGMGVGSVMMDRIRARYAEYGCFLADVEDPAFAGDEADRAVRERRVRFYLRNGFRITSIRSHVYGVDYRILLLPVARNVNDAEAYEAVCAIYESMAAPGAYPAMFEVYQDA